MPTAGWSAQDITDLFVKIDLLQTTLNNVYTRLDTMNTNILGVQTWVAAVNTSVGIVNTSVGTVNTSIGSTNTKLDSVISDIESVVGAPADVDPTIHGHTVPASTGNDPHSGKIINLLRHINNYHDDPAVKKDRFKTPSFSQPLLEAPGKEDLDNNGKIYCVDFIFKNDDELIPSETAANHGLKPSFYVNSERDVDRTDASIAKIAYADYKAWVADDSTALDPLATTHTLTVVGGTFNYAGVPISSGSFVEKMTMTVTAGTPPAGMAFHHWSCNVPTAYIQDANASPTTFGVPTSNSILTANFA